MYFVILLILFSFFGFLSQPLCKAITLPKGKTTRRLKSSRDNAGISQFGLSHVATSSISFATGRSAIANGYRAVANATSCFATLAKTIFFKLGCNKSVSAAWQSRYVRNHEPSRGAKSIMRDFGEVINALDCTP